jgi:ABC-type dipeptide/oligopeptide/nickel transport system ATPase subunit
LIGSIHGHELEKLQTIVLSGSSVLILGESGSGKTTVIQRLIEVIGEAFHHVAIASYTGSTKTLVKAIAEQLQCPVTIPKLNAQGDEIGEKDMSVDEMKTEVMVV